MTRAVAVLLMAAQSPQVVAEECPGGKSYSKAREVVRDMQRIVTPNGIQESYKTTIGGIEQWLNVRGTDKDNPMILFIHGGPASPAIPSLWQFQRPIEEFFTVVHYDQRGAGKKTYREADPESISETLQIERYVDDAIEIAEHVRERYGKDKLILVGHSWGTVLGMKAALKRPDLFRAYVGIGQVINTRVNEELSFQYGLAQARKHGNEQAIAELESIAPYPGDQPITRERIIVARKWPPHYGGLNAFRDAGQDYYYTTPSAPTAGWLEQVDAPYKRGVWFENSPHMVPWEEPGKSLLSLLNYVRPLAAGAGGTDG